MISRLVPLSKLLMLLRASLPSSRILTDFLLYASGSLFLRGISLFVLPFIMQAFTPAHHGTISLLTAFTTIGTALVGMGLRQVLSLEYFHHDANGKKKLINELLLIYSLLAIPALLVAWQLRALFMKYLFFDTVTAIQLIPAFCSLFLFFYAELLYQLLQYEQKAKLLTALQLTIALITTSSTFCSVWFLKSGIIGILWAQCIGQIAATAIGAYLYLRKQYHPHLALAPTVKKIAYYTRYGMPFIPGIICSWVLASSDRWMLGYYCDMNAVGIYAVADLFAQIFYSTILVPWSGSYLPYIMKQFKHNEKDLQFVEQQNKKTMWSTLFLLGIAITAGFFIGRRLLTLVIPEAYHNAFQYILILLFGQLFLLGSYFVSALIQFKRHTLFLAVALAIPALLNVALNALLTPYWGIFGCSIATLISYGIYFMITYQYNQKLVGRKIPRSS